MSADPSPPRYSGKMRCTTGAAIGIGLERVQPLAVGGLARVGVGAGVGEPVAVRRAAAEEPAFDRGLGRHGRADADLDAVAFALAHAAVEGHDQVVGF